MAQARDAGARFALSPGLTESLVQAAQDVRMPFIPGVMTPGEVMCARDFGFGLVKLFPAAQAGGADMLKALSGPLPDMRFCPTGGISLTNLGDYLGLPNVALVGGSWLAPVQLLIEGRWDEITARASEARRQADAAVATGG
jgi:2-dehydro-3-deoxyphosphogluconate aldolase/(4S)-4-hydroxy-2-oxoglutarate aldolase